MKNIKKYFLILLLFELLFAYAPAFAQTTAVPTYNPGVDTQIRKYLCAPPANTNTASNSILFQCINQIYKFAIAFASVIGVFFLVIAGYIYMSAEGNSEGVEKAKNILVTTVTALVILLASFLLLKTLNPDLIQFQSITPPLASNATSTAYQTTGGTTSTTGTASSNCNQQFSGATASAGCTSGTCVNVSNYTTAHDCSSNGNTCLLSPQAAQKALNLISIFNSANTGCTLKLSAAIEGGSGPSSSSCHYLGTSNSGTCADFNVIGYNATCAQAFYNAAQQAGAISFLDEYVQSCVAGTTTGGNIHVNF